MFLRLKDWGEPKLGDFYSYLIVEDYIHNEEKIIPQSKHV